MGKKKAPEGPIWSLRLPGTKKRPLRPFDCLGVPGKWGLRFAHRALREPQWQTSVQSLPFTAVSVTSGTL